MALSLLLLLLLFSSNCKASHFMGTVLSYYPKTTVVDQTAAVVLHVRSSFHNWYQNTYWLCAFGNCGTQTFYDLLVLSSEDGGEWFQVDETWTFLVQTNSHFELWMNSAAWVYNVDNINIWQAATVIDLRNRSDTNKPNTPPLTSILPLLRVPSNCPRDFNLLAFDPDGDDVRCRYGDGLLLECYTCIQQPFLNLSSSCTLSFSPTNSSNGRYVVQMVMEDFPNQNISLTQTDGSQVVKTSNDAISKIPVQFLVSVDPAVPSCTEGLYLPRFLSPTPANGAQLYTFVNEPVIINITAEALNATISELLYSGPSNLNINTLLPGEYIMTWTPSLNEGGESHAICFAAQAIYSGVKYNSELRCIIVTVGNESVISPIPVTTTATPPTTSPPPTTTIHYSAEAVAGLEMRVSSSLSLDGIRDAVIQLIQNELAIRGLPSDVALRFVKTVTTTENTGG